MIDDAMGKELRKGSLKMIVLKIISKKPIHGYDIIHAVETITNGNWVPSPGSIYPVLDYLETKGYVTMEEIDRKKVYTITDEGKKALDAIDEKRRELVKELSLLFGD
ncbi:MAG TPA: PadR family transcriptional regulator [Methanocella sp.]|uniref:PadR family transcriptional regulator n=1 Tax=Methanocella sp. TaxID=2052833 RepID=UPI002D186FBB|nr:PadR family transcriptional regulator [Methanocella sp.]HTY91350.1 PadR family transcriptional regulator [Methanocella sp.]